MSKDTLTSYTELAEILSALPLLVREARRARQLSVRAASVQLEMNAGTLARIENGEDTATSNVIAILAWLGSWVLQGGD